MLFRSAWMDMAFLAMSIHAGLTCPITNPLLSELTISMLAADMTMDEIQRHHIRAVLEQTGGRVRGRHGAAEILGMKPTTLDNRMKKLDVERPKRGSR